MVVEWMKTNPDTLLIVLANRETGWMELNSRPLLDDDLPELSRGE